MNIKTFDFGIYFIYINRDLACLYTWIFTSCKINYFPIKMTAELWRNQLINIVYFCVHNFWVTLADTILCFRFLNYEGIELLKISSINCSNEIILGIPICEADKRVAALDRAVLGSPAPCLSSFSIPEQQPLSHFSGTLRFAEPRGSHWILWFFCL